MKTDLLKSYTDSYTTQPAGPARAYQHSFEGSLSSPTDAVDYNLPQPFFSTPDSFTTDTMFSGTGGFGFDPAVPITPIIPTFPGFEREDHDTMRTTGGSIISTGTLHTVCPTARTGGREERSRG